MRLRVGFALFFVLAGLGARSAAAPLPSAGHRSNATLVLSRTQAVSDARFLLASLREAHPNLFFARSERSADDELRRIEASFGPRVTRVQLFRALAPLAASFGDSHTLVDPYLPEYVAYRSAGGRVFPLELDCLGNDAVVVADYDLDATTRLPVGAVVDSIGGVRTSEAIARLSRYDSGDTSRSSRFNTCRNLREYLWLDGVRPPYAIAYRLPGSPSIRRTASAGATVDSIRLWDRTTEADRYFGPPAVTYADAGTIAVLTLHEFDDNKGVRTFLARAVRRLRERRTRALLIDLRENRGGSTDAARVLIDRLTTLPYRIVSGYETRVSRIAKRTLGARSYREIYGDDAFGAADGALLWSSESAQEPERVADRFTGRTFVLIGSGTVSAASMFAAAVQDAHVGTILGQDSGGFGTLYGERLDITLPVSKLGVSVSTKFFVRPGGDAHVRPVTPDTRLSETAPVGRDDELHAALDVIRSALRQQARR